MTEQQEQVVLVESQGRRLTYDATGWTVDERGFLHILGSGSERPRTLATYAPAHWSLVSRPIAGGLPDQREGQANVSDAGQVRGR